MMLNTVSTMAVRPRIIRFGTDKPRELNEEQLRQLAQVTAARSDGNPGISGRTTFTVTTDFPLTSEQAATIQMYRGAHPAGYDFLGFRSSRQESGKYLNTWQCANSCD